MFDPDAAATPGSGIFGLPCGRATSRVVLLSAPYDATTSYRPGTAGGPSAILQASHQVDLHDGRYGAIHKQGIWLDDESGSVDEIRSLSVRASVRSRGIVERGGATEEDRADLDDVDATGARVEEIVRGFASAAMREQKVPGVLGGEHAVSLGAIRASAESGEVGVLQVDAHMDFRESYEGFRWSHASVMHNVMTTTPGVSVIVQVGIRDFGAAEAAFGRSLGERCRTHFDDDWKDRVASGERYLDLCRRAIDALPGRVHVSFDIDGLDPSLCPHTGTPVPGGLSFHEAATLLHAVRESGRRIVGFDLVEVAPGPDPAEPDWDANVGARLLYKLCGAAGA